MKHSEVFGNALWIGAGDEEVLPVIKDIFEYKAGEKAIINILGLATFVLFINGKRVHKEYFLPLNSEFESNNLPKGEVFNHRAYVETFDITSFLTEGKNVIAVMLGNGWYTNRVYSYWREYTPYGNKKVCYKIELTKNNSTRQVVSGLTAKWTTSFVTEHFSCSGESHSYNNFDYNIFTNPNFEKNFNNVVEEKPLETEYYFTDCPRDCIIETVVPKIIFKDNNQTIYDIGKNTTVIPTVTGNGSVKITVSEALKDGMLDPEHSYYQYFNIDFGNKNLTADMVFTWLGCRYIKTEGNAVIDKVDIVHADIKANSYFNCNNETLNYLYKTFLNTQLTNLHYGMPSDCPQMERKGYTGDGQLVCPAAMYTLDIKRLYDKWIEDIADSQDKITGNVQYTAPYFNAGGGPGGWGCAIVQLPYQYWKFYGDDSKIKKHYNNMLHYFDYLESVSENNLIITAGPNRWCLGDWCTPEAVELPAPFVNNYFYIKSICQVMEIAKYLGHSSDIPILEKRLQARRKFTKQAYFNTWDSRFFGCRQGGNAFALDMGIGDERTEKTNTEYYEKSGVLDTGIFGTDILIRHLFETGQSSLAVKLLTTESPYGIAEWKKRGLTTLPEYWYGGRSYNHPMFGAVTAYLFKYILGITQSENSAGFKNTVIAPAEIPEITTANGFITSPYGKIEVEFSTKANRKIFNISVPKGITANFKYKNINENLKPGKNTITV